MEIRSAILKCMGINLGKLLNITKRPRVIYSLVVLVFSLFLISAHLKEKMLAAYYNQYPIEVLDRSGIPISRQPNSKDHYLRSKTDAPERLKALLVKKEDRFFYYHPGINPVSIARAAWNYLFKGNPGGSSTITQQLVKILLGNEQDRTFENKLTELFYTISLELHLTKETILDMYTKSVYLGNQAQGFEEAGYVYFNKSLDELNDTEILSLLATISSPGDQNPWKGKNKEVTRALALRFGVEDGVAKPSSKASYQEPASFELRSMGVDCKKTCFTTIDNELNEKLRGILQRNILYSYARGVKNGAIVVIKVPENELLAIVGSPDPESASHGSQINMALEPRPIGSTVKPFIYLKAFESGLRPYTEVEDREYKYSIATGFPLYPKNYDGEYRGTVTLHEALSNSLNVPSVKVLEYVGISNFNDFLENDLEFKPIQSLESYQLGIALGGLEMDLLTLTHFFSIFTNNGILSPLTLISGGQGSETSEQIPPQSNIVEVKKISEPAYIQLINKILNDRKTGVNQFGIKSNLNLVQDNYAVKTGTSRDFHDSWVVGYTPDFIVGVWLGNSENTPLVQISGQSGAGRVWQEVMELMFTTPYNKQTPLAFDEIASFEINDSIEYGLRTDNYEDYISILETDDIIISPHHKDVFELVENTSIPFEASRDVMWFINGSYFDEGRSKRFYPSKTGKYEIEALEGGGRKEVIEILVLEESPNLSQ